MPQLHFFHNQGENNKRSLLNLLTPKSDWRLLSPHSTILESNVKVMRIKEMIINLGSSWFSDKFFLSAPEEMKGEQNMGDMNTDVSV